MVVAKILKGFKRKEKTKKEKGPKLTWTQRRANRKEKVKEHIEHGEAIKKQKIQKFKKSNNLLNILLMRKVD